MLLVDKGCLSQTVQLNLFNEVNIQLETPKRKTKWIIERNSINSKNIEKELRLILSTL